MFRGFSIIAVIAMLVVAGDARAQAIAVDDPTGGFTPGATYCPSTGGCFTSLGAAEAALRAAVPDVGQFLYNSRLQKLSNGQIRSYYAVKPQAPLEYYAPYYMFLEDVEATQYCPGSANSFGGCGNEEELISNFFSQRINAGVVYSCGWNRCYNLNPRVEGSYVPLNRTDSTSTPGVGVLDDSTKSRSRKILFDTYYDDHRYRGTPEFPLIRRQRYLCPAGMGPTTGVLANISPYLCQSTAGGTIMITAPRQNAGQCPADNQSCEPSTTNKSSAEADFTFAGRPFARHYNSLREELSGGFNLGRGWSHTYGPVFSPPGTNSSQLVVGGKRMKYQSVGSGRFVISGLGDASMIQAADGRWQITEPNGDISTFSSTLGLVSIHNARAPERDVTLEYNSKNLLERVVDSRGRALQFTHDYFGTLTSVLLPDGTSQTYAYDANGNLVSVSDGHGGVKQYHYGEPGLATNGDPGLLTGVTYEDGKRHSSFGYDVHGRVVLSTQFNAAGQPVNITRMRYASANQAEVQSSSGATRTFTYSADRNRSPLSVVAPNGTRQATFDSYGRTLTRTNVNGSQDRYTYTSGKLTSAISAFGTPDKRTHETVWNATFNVPALERTLNAAGQVVAQTNLDYSATGQLLTTTSVDPSTLATRTATRAYCEQADVDVGTCPRVGLLKAIDGPRTDVSDTNAYAYYGTVGGACSSTLSDCGYRPGDPWKVTDALGRVTEVLAYDAAGRPLAVKDTNGVVTETLYYPRGWVATMTVKGATSADDRITSYEYWPTGLVKRITDPDGVYTTYEYDDAKRLTAVADSAGNRIEYTLDGAGNRIGESTKGAGGVLKRTLSRVYNTLGQLATQADAQSSPTDFTYDAGGNAKTVTDALGHVTSNDYDPLNRLKRTLQDVGGIEAETKFEYDANDNLTKVTDPKGLDTTYSYNGFGDLVQLSSPDTGITTYTYDSAGNRASQTDARGITTTYQYDALNRLTQVGYPTASLNVSYTYDVTQPVCQAGETFSVGRLTLMVDGSGSTQYCHDRFGQLVRKVQTTDGVALTLQYAYTKSGQLQAMTYPDGTVADYVRNAQGQITSVGVTRPGLAREILLHQATHHPFGPIAGWVYGNGRTMQRDVDLDYRPTSIQGGTGGLDLTYGYDVVGNLVDIDSGSSPPMEYRYDALGRLTEALDGPAQAVLDKYEYDKTGNRISYTDSFGTKAYAYPANSHRLDSVAGESRAYDAVGNTLSIGASREFEYNDAGRMSRVRNGGVVAMEYAYNGRGEQVRKHLGAASTYTLYDDSGRWLGDYGTSGAVSQQAVWMDDMPVGVLDGGQLYYIQPDHLGTPRAVFDPIRNIAVWSWNLKGEVFGNTPPEQDADGDDVSFSLDLRFPGQRTDSYAELTQNYLREYDATVGRFSSSDPIGQLGGLSSFGYAGMSPLQFVDPEGLDFFDPIFAGIEYVTGGWTPSQGLVDSVAGFGDSLSFGLSAKVRELNGIGGVDKCSPFYRGGEVAGTAYSLAVPITRLGYVAKARQIPSLGLSARGSVMARNQLKDYFRGPFAETLRNWHAVSYEGLVAAGKTEAQIIAGAGRTSVPWTVGIVGSGVLSTGARVGSNLDNANECFCR